MSGTLASGSTGFGVESVRVGPKQTIPVPARTWVAPALWIGAVLGVMVSGVMFAGSGWVYCQQPLHEVEALWPIAEISAGAPAGLAAVNAVPSHRDAHSARLVVPQRCYWRKGHRPRKC